MDMKTLRENARSRMKGYCNVCPVCDGRACAGKVPGMGGPVTGSAFMENVRALSEVKLNMRVVHTCLEPDTGFTFAGVRLAFPIMNGPIAAPNLNCGPIDDLHFHKCIAKGVLDAGSLPWVGDPCRLDQFEHCCEALREAGRGVAIVKPHVDHKEIFRRYEMAQAAGAVAFGTDLDGAGLVTLRKLGFPVGPKTVEQIKELRAFAPGRPFIVKGVMTPDDALRCLDAGVDCIVVSNHGGRVLDGTPGVAAVLPAIANAVGGHMTVLADGGVRSGVDVLRYLALGAKGVLIGRPACWGVYGGDAEGVALVFRQYADELRQAMILTGCADLGGIGRHAVWA